MSFISVLQAIAKIARTIETVGKIIHGHHQAQYEAGMVDTPPEDLPLDEDWEEIGRLLSAEKDSEVS